MWLLCLLRMSCNMEHDKKGWDTRHLTLVQITRKWAYEHENIIPPHVHSQTNNALFNWALLSSPPKMHLRHFISLIHIFLRTSNIHTRITRQGCIIVIPSLLSLRLFWSLQHQRAPSSHCSKSAHVSIRLQIRPFFSLSQSCRNKFVLSASEFHCLEWGGISEFTSLKENTTHIDTD